MVDEQRNFENPLNKWSQIRSQMFSDRRPDDFLKHLDGYNIPSTSSLTPRQPVWTRNRLLDLFPLFVQPIRMMADQPEDNQPRHADPQEDPPGDVIANQPQAEPENEPQAAAAQEAQQARNNFKQCLTCKFNFRTRIHQEPPQNQLRVPEIEVTPATPPREDSTDVANQQQQQQPAPDPLNRRLKDRLSEMWRNFIYGERVVPEPEPAPVNHLQVPPEQGENPAGPYQQFPGYLD